MSDAEESLVKLRVSTITGEGSGAYTLQLQELCGQRRVQLSVGMAEAQQIAIYMENIRMPRPLTHDLLYTVCQAYGINVLRVIIEDVREGFFIANVVCEREGVPAVFDARTSDAVAMAIRSGAPIYIRGHLLDRVGGHPARAHAAGEQLADLSTAEVRRLMEQAVEAEEYERARELSDELKRRG